MLSNSIRSNTQRDKRIFLFLPDLDSTQQELLPRFGGADGLYENRRWFDVMDTIDGRIIRMEGYPIHLGCQVGAKVFASWAA